MAINTDLYKRYIFFKEWGGWRIGYKAIDALNLAKAEIWAEENDVTYTWEWDDDGELMDHEYWCANARRNNAGYNSDGETTSRYERDHLYQCEHEILGCTAEMDGDIVASLWNIVGADRNYRRIVQAELASEAMYNEQSCKNVMAL